MKNEQRSTPCGSQPKRLKRGEVVERAGGFFYCLDQEQQSLSGPWRTRRAAEYAYLGNYLAVHDEERAARG